MRCKEVFSDWIYLQCIKRLRSMFSLLMNWCLKYSLLRSGRLCLSTSQKRIVFKDAEGCCTDSFHSCSIDQWGCLVIPETHCWKFDGQLSPFMQLCVEPSITCGCLCRSQMTLYSTKAQATTVLSSSRGLWIHMYNGRCIIS